MMKENKNKHSEEVLALYKSLRKTILLMLTTVFTLVVVTVAWFANNSSVNSLLSSISASDKVSFELASVGGVATLGDAALPGEYNDVELGNDYNISDSVKGKWTKGTQTIQWNMNDQSNLNNYAAQDNSESQNDGLSPGAHGKIQFYVIPTEIGKLSGKFNLEIVPLKEPTGSEKTEWIEINDETALRLLRGHLLFYYSHQDNETEITLVNYLNGEFTLDFGTVTTTNPILVTLNWFWPQTLDDAKNGVISNEVKNTDLGTLLSAAMTDKPELFFYHGENQVASETDDDFNNADKYIGDTIDAIILRLNADQAS